MTTQERYIQACVDARTISREHAANMRLELARLTFSTSVTGVTGLGDRTDKQRAEYNRLILAAQDVLWVIARESDLFRCNGCGEHFDSQEARPRCTSSGDMRRHHAVTRETENVPEDIIYCGTCLQGCESTDESGCCPDCARAFREAAR